jgi:hypothetical protein
MADTSMSRTIWAEQHVESFISPSFVSEFVFRSLQVIDGTQKEVADFLIHRADQALLVSQKCQDDPTSRTGEKLGRWARKRAEEAVSQLKGALKRVGVSNEIWCDHPRRGRVSFPDGLPNITHAVATVEVFEPIPLQDELPLDHHGTPISYLSVSDFLNVCIELRTVPEVTRYLDARRSLPASVQLTIGSEGLLFSYYLLRDGTFAGFRSLAATQQLLLERSDELLGVMEVKAERDRHASVLEYVADQLSGRHSHYRDGLSQAVLDYYEPTGERRMYLVMQGLIAGLTLGERAELGRAFAGAIQQRTSQGGKGISLCAAMVDSHSDHVFVLGSFGATATCTRNDLLTHFDPLARAAMAHYGRKRCLIVFDRDGESYEVAHDELLSSSTPGDLEAGSKIFGSLRLYGKEFHVRPN